MQEIIKLCLEGKLDKIARDCFFQQVDTHFYRNHAPRDINRYKCNLCDAKFAEEYYLTCHMSRHPPKAAVLRCDICVATFVSVEDLRQHNLRHLDLDAADPRLTTEGTVDLR